LENAHPRCLVLTISGPLELTSETTLGGISKGLENVFLPMISGFQVIRSGNTVSTIAQVYST